MRVHFICNGNAYRSRLAEAYFRSLNTGIETFSSGARADKGRHSNDPVVVEFTSNYLREHGIDPSRLTSHPVQLTPAMLRDDDVTIVMADALNNAKAAVTLPAGVRVWDIGDFFDPEHMDKEQHERRVHTEQIFKQIRANVDELAAELTN